MKKLFLPLLFLFIISCSNKINFDPVVHFVNESNFVIDSLIIQDMFNKKYVIYNIDPQVEIQKTITLKGKSYPEGDYFAFGIFVFKDSVFYRTGYDLIDVPFSNLKEEYTYYFWNNGSGYYYGSKKRVSDPNRISKENLMSKKFYFDEK